MNEEIYRDIKENTNYQITNFGRVYSKKRNIFLKPRLINGYLGVHFNIAPKKVKNFKIHRLVARQFVPCPVQYGEVNHLDGDKTNNHFMNLQWCSRSENMVHCYQELKRYNALQQNHHCKGKFGKDHHISVRVKQMTKQNKLIKVWDCISDVTRELGIDSSSISKVCRNKWKSAGGYSWQYLGGQNNVRDF